jgi:C-terminal processing protease CtpA/Prc
MTLRIEGFAPRQRLHHDETFPGRRWLRLPKTVNSVMSTRVVLCGVVLLASLAARGQAAIVAGHVLNAEGRPVAGVTVLVCDQQSGVPVLRESWKPFTAGTPNSTDGLLWTTTDEGGAFAFDDAKPGAYRMLAQSWEDAAGPIRGPLEEENGRVVRVCGVAERIDVPSAAAGEIELKPIGSATLELVTDPKCGNNSTLMVVSRSPMPADPVLAFSAWTGDFMPAVLAGNRMPLGQTTVHGLPAGKVHIGAFAPDNNPGFGGVTVELETGKTTAASVPMLATWSDGHYAPPDRLLPLVKRVRQLGGQQAVMALIGQQHPDFAEAFAGVKKAGLAGWAFLGPFLDRTVKLGDDESVLVKDLTAAGAYSSLMSHFEYRAERRKQDELKRLKVDRSVTYEQAAEALHKYLGDRYPCFALKGIDWDAVGQRLLPRARTVTTDEEFGLLCLEIVAALEDSHAQLRAAAADLPRISFPSWDAGFACLVDETERPTVYFVQSGGSAQMAGVRVGMTVEKINGKPVDEAIESAMQDLSKYVGYSSRRCLRYDAYRLFARQTDRGGGVTIEVIDLAGNRRELDMTADAPAGYLPRLPVASEGINDSADVGWKMLDDQVGYIYVRRIGNKLIESLDEAVRDLGPAKGIIVDVRGNSGGGFDAARAHRNFNPADPAEPDRPRYGGPIAVLIDARCISAGEGWTSWFVANKRAKLFGETTAGASSRKADYLLTNGLFQVRFPVKAYAGFLDRPIERTGLVPDVPLMQKARDLAEGRDTVLEAARQHLLAHEQ